MDKYAKLLGLEFWLPDWFVDNVTFITVTIPIGTKFNTGKLDLLRVYGDEHWIILKITKQVKIEITETE